MNHAPPEQILRSLQRGLNAAGAAVTGVAVLVVAWLFYGPLGRDAAEASQRGAALGQLLRNERHIRADYANLHKQIEAARKQESEMKLRIPDDPHEADFLRQVSQAANDVGLQITDYRPGAITAEKSCSAIQVQLIGEGNYQSICRFLDRLPSLPRHSTVVRLDIDAGKAPPAYVVTMCLELYFLGHDRPSNTK